MLHSKPAWSAVVALIVVGLVSSAFATDWLTYDARILIKPEMAGYQSVYYDPAAGEFLAAYYRPGLWLARCTPDECVQEPVVADDLGSVHVFVDDVGIGIAYNGGGGINVLRETESGWTAASLIPSDVCTTLGTVTFNEAGETALLCNLHAVGNRIAWRHEGEWLWDDAPMDVGSQALAYTSDGTVHGMRVYLYYEPEQRFVISHVYREPEGDWVDDPLVDTLWNPYHPAPQSWSVIASGDTVHLFYQRGNESYGHLTVDPDGSVTHMTNNGPADSVEIDENYLFNTAPLPDGEATFVSYRYFYNQTDAPDWISWGSVLAEGNVFLRSIGGNTSMDDAATFRGLVATQADGTPHNIIFANGDWYLFPWPRVSYNYNHEEWIDEIELAEPALLYYGSPLLVAAAPTATGLRPYLQTMLVHTRDTSRNYLYGFQNDQWPAIRIWSEVLDYSAPLALAVTSAGVHGLQLGLDTYLKYYLYTLADAADAAELVYVMEPPNYQKMVSADLLADGDDLLLAFALENSPGAIHFAARPAGGPLDEPVVVADAGSLPRLAVCNDGTVYLAYRDGDEVKLAVQGEPWTAQTVAGPYDSSRGLGVTCTDDETLHVIFDDGDNVYHAVESADGWNVSTLQTGAYVTAVRPDATGLPWVATVVNPASDARGAKLFHWTGAAWDAELLHDELDPELTYPAFGLWAGDDDLLACYTLADKVECKSTAQLEESWFAVDDDTVDDDTIDDDTVDDDTVDDDTVDDDTVDDDTVDDDTVDDDTVDDDTVDDDTVDDDTVDDDTVDDDTVDDDTVDDDTDDDDSTPDDDDSTPGDDDTTPGDDDDDDDNDDGCGK
ncbi:MAG TPA: hypothetical protein PKW95_07900 [bacterium]|nr:hypothetical protein [bacterium]